MYHSKKTRVQPFKGRVKTRNTSSKQQINHQKIVEKSKSSKRKYIAAAIMGGLGICGLFAVAVVVPLVYSLNASKNETTTTSLPVPISTAAIMAGANVTSAIITTGTNVISTTMTIGTNSTNTILTTGTNATSTIATTVTATTTSTNVTKTCGNNATLITFDDLTPLIPVPNGYNNMNWANVYTYSTPTNTSGYYTGIVSGNTTSFNWYGNPANMTSANSSLFTLFSAAVAAAWCNDLQLTVVGYNSNTIIANNTFTIQIYTVAYLTFIGYLGLDTVTFSTSGGTTNTNGACTARQYAMDNICLTFT